MLNFHNFINIEWTWNGYQIQIYSWKLIKCKQTADCKQTAESKQTADAKFWQCYENRIYKKHSNSTNLQFQQM